MTEPSPQPKVRRRTVLYIPGYDPSPPRSYRERYRREAAKQAAVSGHDIALEAAQTEGDYGWTVTARIEGADVRTEMRVLPWADIVRSSMARGVVATYGQLFRTVWIYVRSGAFFRLLRLRKGPVIAALYPVVMLMGQLCVALSVGGFVAWSVSLFAEAWSGVGSGGVFGALVGLALGGLVAGLLLRWVCRRDPLMAWYLMHDYAFSAQLWGAYPSEQEDRLADFRAALVQALSGDVDEVLVVGHSSGAYMAVSVVADVLRGEQIAGPAPVLSLLTLGHVVPMVSFLPRAQWLRADLALLSEAASLTWVDVTAPGDGCSFALCDPVGVTGVAGPAKRWPLVISAAFRKTLSASAQRAQRWRFFERHFQYLNAFDRLSDDPGAYDYFAVTAGPKTLRTRFSGRRPSVSRLDAPVSGYSDQAA